MLNLVDLYQYLLCKPFTTRFHLASLKSGSLKYIRWSLHPALLQMAPPTHINTSCGGTATRSPYLFSLTALYFLHCDSSAVPSGRFLSWHEKSWDETWGAGFKKTWRISVPAYRTMPEVAERSPVPAAEGNIPLDTDSVKVEETEESSRRRWRTDEFDMTKTILHAGGSGLHGGEFPRFGATAQVSLAAESCSGITVDQLTTDFFYSKYFNHSRLKEIGTEGTDTMRIGDADSELDKALERCVRSMRRGERCRLDLRVAFDVARNGRKRRQEDKQQEEAAIQKVELICLITLVNFLNAEPVSKWHPETKVDKAKEISASAVRLFKMGRVLDSFHKFHLALKLLTFVLEKDRQKTDADDVTVDPSLVSQARDMTSTCYSNLAACHFQWGNHEHVVKLAGRVLATQSDNVKMLYRRGVAYLAMKDFEEAQKDLTKAHRLDPTNKAINDKLGQLRIAEKKHQERLAAGLKKMFE